MPSASRVRVVVGLVLAVAATSLAATSLAATNLNSSKSNVYRVTYASELASAQQVAALLTELDKLGPASEAKLKQWLPANFRRLGIAPEKIKKLIVFPAGKLAPETTIILLTRPEDEPQALVTTVKSSKSNSQN